MYRSLSPGSPAPVSFGMGKDPSQSLSLTPGGGSVGTDIFGTPLSGGAGGAPAPSSGPIPSGWTPDTSLSVKNLAPVNVNAITTGGPSSLDLYSGGGAMGSGAGPSFGAPSVPLSVKDLAPVHVTAQMPAPTNWFDNYMMWSNDHPMLSKLAESAVGGVTGLSPVLVAAHAYYNSQHGQPLFGNLLGKLSGALGGLGSLGDGPGSPLSNSPNTPLFSDLYGQQASGSGADTSYGIGSGVSGSPSIATSGSLPYYPGLSALSGGSAPIGGFWNQQALRDASPAYGPYAGFAQGAAPNPNPYGLPPALAPTGIRGS
jgi:hypothetical protein